MPTDAEIASLMRQLQGSVAPEVQGLYSAPGLGVDNTGATDVTQALFDLINTAASDPTQENAAAVVLLDGTYRCDEDLHIKRSVTLRGVGTGMGQWSKSRLIFGTGKGIIVDTISSGPGDGSALWSVIENLDIFSQPYALVARVPSTAVALGTRVYSEGDNRFFWECTQAGTTGAGATAPYETFSPPGSTNRTFWAIGTTFTDGTVEWTTRTHSAISIKAPRVIVRECAIASFTNAGILATRYDPGDQVFAVNSNLLQIKRNRIYATGMGIALAGNDANAGITEGNSIETVGVNIIPGTGGHGIQDHSFLGNTHIGNHCAGQTGHCYDTLQFGVQHGIWIGNYDEHGSTDATKARIYGPNIWLGGAAVVDMSVSNGVVLKGNNLYNAQFADQTLGENNDLLGGMNLPTNPVAWWFGSQHEGTPAGGGNVFSPSHALAWKYSAGEYRLGFWNSVLQAIALTGARSPSGKYHWRDIRGHFLGEGEEEIWIGTDSSRQLYSRFRRSGTATPGLQKVGDRFHVPGDGQAGSYTGLIVSVAGYRGDASVTGHSRWVPNVTYSAYSDAYTTISEMVEPSDSDPDEPAEGTPVFRCVVTGPSGTTEPDWEAHRDGVSFLDHEGSTLEWKYVGDVPVYRPFGKIE